MIEKKAMLYLLLLMVGFFAGYLLKSMTIKPVIVKELQTEVAKKNKLTPEQEFEKSQKKNTINIPAKYFDVKTDDYGGIGTPIYTLIGLFSVEPPEPIALNSDINVIREDIPQNKCDISGNGFCPEFSYEEGIDVDNDGRKEKILRIWNGVNHGVKDLYIIKNNQVIFQNQDSPVNIEASKSNNGFYLYYDDTTFLGVLGSKTTVRYIHDHGKFIPVWKQSFHEIGTLQR